MMPLDKHTRALLALVNQVCEIEQEVARLTSAGRLPRIVERTKSALAELGLSYQCPLGESFSETRTDVEAHISGTSTENLRVVEVLKPVIRQTMDGRSLIIQKGVVVVAAEGGLS